MLRHFGGIVEVTDEADGRHVTVTGGTELSGRDVTVPGDPSSAAFLIAAALMGLGPDVTIEGVLVNETRTGLYTTLKEMGADLHVPPRTRGRRRAELPTFARGLQKLKGVRVPRRVRPA